jgi:DNA polymerase-1
MVSTPVLAQLFAAAGNSLKGTSKGFTCGHEPVHQSKSGACVSIDTAKGSWFCRSCGIGGDAIAAAMSLRGLTREEATALVHQMKEAAGEEDSGRSRESQADHLATIAKNHPLFHDEYRDSYAVVPVNGHNEVLKCRGTWFKQYLRYRFFTEYGKAPSSEAVSSALGVIEGLAIFAGECRPLANRVAWHAGAIWYDLTDSEWRAVKITPDGWEIIADPPILFRRYSHQAPQVMPVQGGSLALLDRYANVTEDARLLLKVTLGTFLIPEIPHAGIHTYGGKGAGKSFLLWAIRQTIDPSHVPLLSLPKDKAELSQQLAHHYAPFYDNLSVLQNWTSEALCRAVTGEGYTKRQLFSDDDDIIYKFRRCIGLNGINIVATETDILDRLVLIEMERIEKKHRKEDKELLNFFERDRPKLLGAVFDAISKAMQLKPLIRLRNLPRMADYTVWGEAISRAIGEQPGVFFSLYNKNIQSQHEEVVRGHAVAAAVAACMEERDLWKGTPTELLADLNTVAERIKLDTKDSAWPKAPNTLTRRLKEVQSDLLEVGISVVFSEDEKRHSRIAITRVEETSGVSGVSGDFNDSEDLGAENSAGYEDKYPGGIREESGPRSSSSDTEPDSPDTEPDTPDTDSRIRGEKDLKNQYVPDMPDTPDTFSTLVHGCEEEEASAERRAIQDADLCTDVPPEFFDRGGYVNGHTPEWTGTIEVGDSPDTPDFEYIVTATRLEAVLPDLLAAAAIGLDTETTGLDPLRDRLRLIQISTPQKTVVIDAYTCPMQMLAPVFSRPRQMIGHNLKFDLQFLISAGLPWPIGTVFDTMLAARLLGAGCTVPPKGYYGLEAVVARYLGITVDKAEQTSKWTGELRHEQLVYAAKDAAILLPLADRLQEDLATAGLTQIAAIENRCLLALAWMELCGLPIDREQWLARAAEETHRAQALHAHLAALIGQPYTNGNGNGLHLNGDPHVNWDSPKQVLEVFRSRGHTLANTASQSIQALIGKDPLAEMLIEYKEAKMRASTYGEAWIKKHVHPVTGRVHADYFQLGSAAGRMSCTNPNVQNLPRNGSYRASIRVDEGRAIVKADWSQIELRIAAVLADDHNMLAAFRSGEDLHKLTAAKVLGISLDQVGKEHRQLAKALNFGLLYGMGAKRLQGNAATEYKVSLTESQASAHRKRFFSAYPGLARWHAHTGARLEEEAELETRTLTGRRRQGISKYTVALNSPVQGTGADGLKLALARLYEHRAEVPDAQLIACVHDEIVAECPEEGAAQTATWLKHHMIAAMTEIIGDSVPVEVETTIGRDWAGTPLETHRETSENRASAHFAETGTRA